MSARKAQVRSNRSLGLTSCFGCLSYDFKACRAEVGYLIGQRMEERFKYVMTGDIETILYYLISATLFVRER